MAQRGNSQEKLHDRLRGQDNRISRLNQEADNLKQRINQMEESKNALSNNRQLRESQEKYEQHIQMLESDKVSLMKRLNMVLSELEKATHDKSEISAKLLEQERTADDLKKKLDEVSSLKNVVNRNLQEDLRYERELNEKLRDELNRFEREKEQLLNRLKEQEQISQEISRETSAINNNLQRKNEDLRRLERDHEANLTRLKELNNQLDHLRGQELHTKTEKRRMEDELEHLTRERNDLIRRMNELSDKYEDYVSTMNRERIEIMRANKNHVKLLTTKLFFQILNEMIVKRKTEGFKEMKSTADHIKNMELKMQRFTKIMTNYGTDRKRHFLRLWYRKAMNFVHENYKKLNLVEFNVNKKRKIKFYYKWREAFLLARKHQDSRIDSLKVLRSLVESKKDLQLRRYICKWRDFVDLRRVQQDFFLSTMGRKRMRSMRQGFVNWLGFTKKKGLEQRYDQMSELVTNLWFKQRVFLGLRQACQESKNENSMMKFKAWKDWCEKSRKNKYYARKKLLVARTEGVRCERLLKKCFDAIKFSNIQARYEETKDRLEKEIPVREELERKRDTLLKVNKTKDKYNMFRQMCIRYADLKYRALQIWRENVRYHNQVMNRIKLRLIETHKRNLSRLFYKWKENIDKKHVVELVSFTEDLINENQELQNTLQACKKEREKLQDCSSKQQGLKLERIRNMLNRNLLRRRFAQWSYNTQYVVSLEDALFLTSKTIRRRKLRNAFNKYKKQVKEAKRLEYIRTKVDWFGGIRERETTLNCFVEWKQYVKTIKQGKKFLIRSMKGIDRAMQNEAFNNWKNAVYQQRKQLYVNNIGELEKRQKEHEAQIQNLEKEIEVNDSIKRHLMSKMQSQSHKIMANFISRYLHSSLAKGFYTWQDTIKEKNNKKRFLRSTLLYWMKNNYAKGFRQWAEYTFKAKEAELSRQLQERETEKRSVLQLKEEEEKKQNSEVEDLTKALKEATQLKEQLKANFEKALDTHISRIGKNHYIDKKKNIFTTWADYIKREKNAINTIGALTRKYLRMEVWSRIRLVARENYLDTRAERILFKFSRMFKQNLVQHAFSRWRVNSYTYLVNKMVSRQDELVRTKENRENELANMEIQKHKKAERILKQKKQREIANAWIETTKVLRTLKVKQELLKQNLQFIQLKFAARKWKKRAQTTIYLRRKDQQVIQKWNEKIMKFCYQGWVKRLKIERQLCNRVVKFVKRMSYLDIAHGFQQIIHFKRSLDERVRERKEHGGSTIYKTLNRIMKHKLADVMLNLKNRAFKKDFKERFLLRAFRHVLLYRMRHFFGKWKHNKERIELAQHINTEGDVVLERNEMRRNVKVLKDFLKKQGYSPEEIEQYLQKKGEQQKQNMHKAIISLFFKNSEFQIMPKALNQWKRWVQIRKLMKRNASFVVNALNHPAHWAFRKWKYQEADAKEKLKEVTKTELIDKIIQDEMAIGSSKSKIQRMEDAIENLQFQRGSLLQHYISGQKLALSLGKNNYHKSMFRAFIKWKRSTKEYEQLKLAEQLDRTNQMINDLMNHVGKLENINKTLHSENEELRQAALDGIEIAKAVQELTREREQLSVDLQDRASTIKKLIEDNNNLSMRLSIAQKEAEQLEQLNQQSYLAPPERDRYY